MSDGSGTMEQTTTREGVSGLRWHRVFNKLPLLLFVGSGLAEGLGWIVAGDTLHVAGFYMLGFGVIFAVLAAGFGIRDWVAIPEGRQSKTVAFNHGWLMAAALMTLAVIWVLRYNRPADPSPGLSGLMLGALAILLFGGWRGARAIALLEREDAQASADRSAPR